MKWLASVLVQARDGATHKRNDKLPLNEKLRVIRYTPVHEKNLANGVDPLGATLEIAGTLEGTASEVLGAITEALRGVAKPDGFITIEIDPK